MNRKGFTLVELLATLVVLALIVGVVMVFVGDGIGDAKKGSEEAFVDTLRDAMNVYLASDAKSESFSNICRNSLSKKHGTVKVYYKNVNFSKILNSSLKPLDSNEFVNPINENVACNKNATVTIYRDEDYVYYYRVSTSNLSCLKYTSSTYIDNLPEGFSC